MSESVLSMTLESHLASFKSFSACYSHLYSAWQIAKEDLPKILRNIILVFPHYSRHDESHSETIIRRIESILGENRIKQLQATETWLILMSAYTHDLGMLVRHDELRQVWKTSEFLDYLRDILEDDLKSDMKKYVNCFFQNKLGSESVLPSDWPIDVQWAVIVLSADYFRSRHPERSKNIIWDEVYGASYFKMDFSFNNFIPERLIKLLGDIVFLHGQPFEKIFDLKKQTNGIGLSGDIIYPRRIATLLRLGDLLDMDNGRFDENAYCLYGEVPDMTLENRNKHAALTHFLVTENLIEVSVDCPTEGSFEIASQWLNWLKDEVDNLSLHWNEIVSDHFGTAPTMIQPEIKLNGKFLKGNSLWRFNFSNDAIFELLEGANIYKNKFSCIRELVQNAIDASKMRLWHQIQSGDFGFEKLVTKDETKIFPFHISSERYKQFKINIEITYIDQQDGYEVSVSDHGIGISIDRLNQIGQVASTWYMQRELNKLLKKMPLWLQPTGAFGIGIQSVFQVTDKLECITYSEQELPKKIIFRSKLNGGRISYQEINSPIPMKLGSKFSFFISDSVFDELRFSPGDRVDIGINTSDPFLMDEQSIQRYLKLFYLVECIKNDIGKNLFPIHLVANIDGESYEETYPSIDYNYLQDMFLIDENIFAKFNLNEGHILAYDIKFAISFDLHLNFRQRGMLFMFKGMHVKFDYWRMLSRSYRYAISGEIGLDGFSTSEYLTLSREQIKNEKREEINNILNQDIELLINKYYVEIGKTDLNDNLSSDIWLSLAILYQRISCKDQCLAESCKKKIFENLKFVIPCYIVENDSCQRSEKSIKSFFEEIFSGKSFYIFESHMLEFSNRGTLSEEKILDIYKHSSINNQICIYHKDTVEDFLDTNLCCLLNVYDDETLNGYSWIYEYQVIQNMIILPSVTESMKKELYKRLLEQPRMVTIALKDYENIAVNYVPTFIAWSKRRYHMWFSMSYYNKYYAITPFIKDDIILVGEGRSAEELWNNIYQRNDFLKLVDYVYEHNVRSEKISKDNIINSYRSWIFDILRINNESV